MTTKTLRALAREYAEGAVDKESYRKARDAYFKAVLAGTVQVQPIEYRPPLEAQDLDATVEKTTLRPLDSRAQTGQEAGQLETEPPAESNTGSAEPPAKDTPYLFVTTILLIIAAVGVSIALLMSAGGDESGSTMTGAETKGATEPAVETSTVEETQVEPATASSPAPAETLIEDFLQENNWSENNLREFRNDWQALSPEEQEQGLASPLRVKLVNAIHQELVEERALMGLGDTEQVIARQHKLVNFASELEISDPRLTVEGETAPAETETPIPAAE